MLGHIEDYCEKLYSADEDDDTRLWGPELRVEKQRKNGGGGVRRQSESGGGASPIAVTVSNGNGCDINVPIKTANFAALEHLLRNPQLMRPAKINNGVISNSVNAELLQEENEEKIITSKPKRSRGLNEVNQPINTINNKSSPAVNEAEIDATETSALADQKSSYHENTSASHECNHAPVEVSHSATHFLSAKPGFQTCRKQ